VTEIVLEDWNGHYESFEDDPEDQEASGVASEDDEGGEGEDFIVYAGGNEETGDGEDGEDGEYGEYGEDGEMVKMVKMVKLVKMVKMEINGAPPVEFDCSLQDKLPTISFQISGDNMK